MTFLIVLGCILIIFGLLGQIRVGVAVAYSEAGLRLNVKAGPARIQLFPANENKKEKQPPKPKKQRSGNQSETEKPKRNVKDTVSVALRFLPLAAEAAGRFKRKIRIDRIKIHIIWGAADPAAAAKGYGAGNAAMGIIWPAVEHNFRVKDYDLRVDVDFERKKPELLADAQATLTVGQCFSFALVLGFKALKIFLGIRREQPEKNKNEKAVQA